MNELQLNDGRSDQSLRTYGTGYLQLQRNIFISDEVTDEVTDNVPNEVTEKVTK